MNALILQLADSAFPAGAFAHSGGLESAWQQGLVQDGEELKALLIAQIEHIASLSAPFTAAACRFAGQAHELDAAYDATQLNHIGRASSQVQGQALLAAARKIFPSDEMEAIAAHLRQNHSPCHLPVIFGIVCSLLGVSAEHSVHLYLFTSLRSLTSAAVRLSIVGPLAGQRIQYEVALELENLAAHAAETPIEAAAATNPLLEVCQAMHDRLYSRLFIS